MTFKISEHVETLATELSKLELLRRVAFAAQCSELLLDEARSFLGRMMGAQRVLTLGSVLNEAWRQVDGLSERNAHVISEAQRICESSWWTEDDLEAEGDDYLSDVSIECLLCFLDLMDCMETGSARAAAATAEHVLNQMDSKLSSLDVANPFSDERFIGEVERQRRMLSYLARGEGLSTIFREKFRS